MTRQIVLVHGRSQQLLDPDRLKQRWLEALTDGLSKQGLELPSDTVVRFPYYGDTLIALLEGRSPEEAARVIIRGDAESDGQDERGFAWTVINEIKAEAGISDAEVTAELDAGAIEKGPGNWEWVQAILRVVDRRLAGGSGTAIALATKDVYHYLVTQSTKQIIDEGVAGAMSADVENVVVSHSLGTVVAHSVLTQYGVDKGWKVPQLVTLGSPLGVSRVVQDIPPPRWPKCVDAWFNAMDERDVVALYPLTPDHFRVGGGRSIENKTDVDNHTSNRHGIAGYLSDPDVARVIYEAVVA